MDDGTDLIVTIEGDPTGGGLAPPGQFLLRLQANADFKKDYSINLAFNGLSTGPTNDTCASAATLVADVAPTTTKGFTAGGSNTLAGDCNGDDQVPASSTIGGAPDV